jgi:hypothetical protein
MHRALFLTPATILVRCLLPACLLAIPARAAMKAGSEPRAAA